jgi:hypothetical protein
LKTRKSFPGRRCLTTRTDWKNKYDSGQVAQLDDSLTEVDENDNVIRSVTKLEGHLKKDGKPVKRPHRAFSLFLFNSKNELLLQ